jgi:catechol 2,3-dioxygenase-like lactoylglutathione lyase family enzyme
MLHHVEINVSNIEECYRFYSWLLPELGFDIYQQWEKGFSFKEGSTYLVFVQTEKRYMDIPFHRSGVGLNHLAFHGTRELIDRLTIELKEKRIPILYEDRHPYAGGPDYYAVFFEGPDRLKLEIAESPHKSENY